MFDFDSGKLLIIGIVALVVIGPKELPGVLHQVGQTVARLRRMAAEFQGQFMEAMRESELHDLKKDVEKMADLDGLNPFHDLKTQVNATKAEIDTALNASASATPNVDLPKLEETPAPGEATIAAAGVGPVAQVAEVEIADATSTSESAAAAKAIENALPATGDRA